MDETAANEMRKTKEENGYTVDIIDNVEFEGKIFTFPNVKTAYRKNLVAFVESKGGEVVKARPTNVDYIIVDTDDDESLSSVRKAQAKRGENSSPAIMSVWDFCRLTGAKAYLPPEIDTTEYLENGTQKIVNGCLVERLDQLRIAGTVFAMSGMKSASRNPVTAFILEYGGSVLKTSNSEVDYLIVDTNDENAIETCARQREKDPEAKAISLKDFCSLTGLEIGNRMVDHSELSRDGRAAYYKLWAYYSSFLEEDPSYFGRRKSLQFMTTNQLLKEAQDCGVYDAPIRPNDEGGAYSYVSFNSHNAGAVKDILRRLQEDGFRLWCNTGLDEENPGQTTEKRSNATTAIVMLSEEYLASAACLADLQALVDAQQTIIPIYLDDCTVGGESAEKINALRAIRLGAMSPSDFYANLYSSPALQTTRDPAVISAKAAADEKREARKQTLLADMDAYAAEQAAEQAANEARINEVNAKLEELKAQKSKLTPALGINLTADAVRETSLQDELTPVAETTSEISELNVRIAELQQKLSEQQTSHAQEIQALQQKLNEQQTAYDREVHALKEELAGARIEVRSLRSLQKERNLLQKLLAIFRKN